MVFFMIPNEPDAFVTRKNGAAALKEAGYPVAEATLASQATRGGGPPYRKFGQRVLYRWGDMLEWALSKLVPLVHSTSELDTALPRPLVRASLQPARRGQKR